ncbi:hypothetical protein B0H21DRAFT_750251 [Amylocystis lapponica]|nr:hypothetical protein B0H21DRAFT_750251 [Amylocystis lapponica]
MPANTRQLTSPRATIPRPQLPVEHANPQIRTLDPSKPPPVKFQEIVRDGQVTVVGRIKIPTPNGHAFILRRLDTGAISLTTMFRAAFPTATEEAERAEASWVKVSYDIAGANRSGKARFAGTWVNPDVAIAIADSYSLGPFIPSLAESSPDPNIVYRKSKQGQAQQPTPSVSPAAPSPRTPPTPQSRDPAPNPSKRRREASPPHASETTTAPAPAPQTPAQARTVNSPVPRRSARLKSPPPASAPAPSILSPKSQRKTRKGAHIPAGSDETVVDDEASEVSKAMEPNMSQDIQEQRDLIARLKAARDADRKAKEAAVEAEEDEDEEEDEEAESASASTAQKRTREDEDAQLTFDFKQPEVGERTIATNRRVGLLRATPQRKSLAWGALAFAAGLGAMSFLPNLQAYLA